ncbi:MAG: archaellum operon transcriptional activator EarA family protein [Patescibacteria group bacterium]
MSKPILDNLFGSKIRVKILKFLYRNFPADFSVREIAQRIKEPPQTTRDELELLRQITVVKHKK